MKVILIIILILVLLVVYYLLMKNVKQESDMQNLSFENSFVVDVRTTEEFAGGHHEKSVNIPLSDIESGKIDAFKKTDKENIIVVCRSGARSGMAKNILEQSGIGKKVFNLGSWQNLSQLK